MTCCLITSENKPNAVNMYFSDSIDNSHLCKYFYLLSIYIHWKGSEWERNRTCKYTHTRNCIFLINVLKFGTGKLIDCSQSLKVD